MTGGHTPMGMTGDHIHSDMTRSHTPMGMTRDHIHSDMTRVAERSCFLWKKSMDRKMNSLESGEII